MSFAEKKRFAKKTKNLMESIFTIAEESQYTKAERGYRLEKCNTVADPKLKQVCKFMAQSIQEGEVNYMTLKGKYVLWKVCELQRRWDPCRRSCQLTKAFFKDLDYTKCGLLREEWQRECT